MCKGELQLGVLYETMDLELCSAVLTLPFSGLVELEGSYEEQGAEIAPVLTSLNAALENGAVTAEAGVCLQCTVTRMVSVPMVEDAYATRGILRAEYQSCTIQPRLDSRLLRQELRHELPAQAAEVVRAEALPDAPELQYGEGTLRVRTPVLLRVLYRDAGGEYRQAEGRTELSADEPISSMSFTTSLKYASITSCEQEIASRSEVSSPSISCSLYSLRMSAVR